MVGERVPQEVYDLAIKRMSALRERCDRLEAENLRLTAALRAARRGVDSAELGEGYGANLPDVVRDIDAALASARAL